MVIIQVIKRDCTDTWKRNFQIIIFFNVVADFCLENIIKYLWFVKQKNYNIFTNEALEFQGGVGAAGSVNISKRYAISYSMGKDL